MKSFAILTVCVLFGLALGENQVDSHIEPFMFEDLINKTIEALRPDIPDPLKIANLTIKIPDGIDLLTGAANVSNFELTGLQGFQVPYLNLAVVGMRLNFTFVLPSINLYTDYWGDLTVANLVPFYGSGKANVHILNAEIQGSAQADLSHGISVKNLHIQLYVGSASFDIHGALDNEDFSQILSALLNDLVASFIDNHQKVISDILSPIIEGLINAILSGGNSSTTPTSATTA
ncbi:uncharacterized protein LOC123013246 [Tribolium madens]|uniref:uncharacterized protein LOC123013246 n=1 Tax=Tribolium madens TaxID=41895 RepID=UPI001CF72BA5|nr:uncharacterized protein LOC123013246 [Tribolium madens]